MMALSAWALFTTTARSLRAAHAASGVVLWFNPLVGARASTKLRSEFEVSPLAFRAGGKYAGVSTAQPIEDVIFGSLVRSRGVA